jgi:hypothetical protein
MSPFQPAFRSTLSSSCRTFEISREDRKSELAVERSELGIFSHADIVKVRSAGPAKAHPEVRKCARLKSGGFANLAARSPDVPKIPRLLPGEPTLTAAMAELPTVADVVPANRATKAMGNDSRDGRSTPTAKKKTEPKLSVVEVHECDDGEHQRHDRRNRQHSSSAAISLKRRRKRNTAVGLGVHSFCPTLYRPKGGWLNEIGSLLEGALAVSAFSHSQKDPQIVGMLCTVWGKVPIDQVSDWPPVVDVLGGWK